jgi:hypothetical protein
MILGYEYLAIFNLLYRSSKANLNSYPFADQLLDFIEDIHDSLFFGFQNTVCKMLVMGKSGIVMMGRIVISEYQSAIFIDQMESF